MNGQLVVHVWTGSGEHFVNLTTTFPGRDLVTGLRAVALELDGATVARLPINPAGRPRRVRSTRHEQRARCICAGADVCLGIPGESDACGACLELPEGMPCLDDPEGWV